MKEGKFFKIRVFEKIIRYKEKRILKVMYIWENFKYKARKLNFIYVY